MVTGIAAGINVFTKDDCEFCTAHGPGTRATLQWNLVCPLCLYTITCLFAFILLIMPCCFGASSDVLRAACVFCSTGYEAMTWTERGKRIHIYPSTKC